MILRRPLTLKAEKGKLAGRELDATAQRRENDFGGVFCYGGDGLDGKGIVLAADQGEEKFIPGDNETPPGQDDCHPGEAFPMAVASVDGKGMGQGKAQGARDRPPGPERGRGPQRDAGRGKVKENRPSFGNTPFADLLKK